MFKCAIKEQKLAYFISVCRINWSLARLRFSSFSFSSFLIFLMSSLRLMMFALKFHLPTSQTDNFCETRPRLLNVLRMLTVCPWSTPVWLLTSACIETVPFHKFHKTVANRVTHLDTGWPPFSVPEKSRLLRRRWWFGMVTNLIQVMMKKIYSYNAIRWKLFGEKHQQLWALC